MDPITITVLALESATTQTMLISCDFAVISDSLRDAVRLQIQEKIAEIDTQSIFLNATHSHSSPEIQTENDIIRTNIVGAEAPTCFGLSPEELGVMAPGDYVAELIEKIVSAADEAWKTRAPGGIAYGLGYAVVGRNRRLSYYTGESRMYGKSNDPEFSHVEGYEDHSVNLLCTYDADKKLTGMIVNLACPSQVTESIYRVSADFWHDTRVELRRRLGDKLFVLPQCSAAGDQSPHVLINNRAEARMLYLKGLTDEITEVPNNNLGAPEALRKEIALRISDAVTGILPYLEREIDWNPVAEHRVETVKLARSAFTGEDVGNALAEAEKLRVQFDELKSEFEAHPDKKQEPRWYKEVTAAYRRMLWFKGVAERAGMQKESSRMPVEIHVIRLGDVVFAANPFEYYLDFGMQIKARSPAVQTFVIQLAGTAGTYVPTARALAGKGYGAIPASNPVGPEGGRELVDATLNLINQIWDKRKV